MFPAQGASVCSSSRNKTQGPPPCAVRFRRRVAQTQWTLSPMSSCPTADVVQPKAEVHARRQAEGREHMELRRMPLSATGNQS